MSEPRRSCGAKTRTGAPCRRPPMSNGRCYLHGGASLRGVASPSFRGRGWSKYLPAALGARLAEAKGDQDLLALSDEISLVDVRLGQLAERLGTGESGQSWSQVAAAAAELDRELRGLVGAYRTLDLVEVVNRIEEARERTRRLSELASGGARDAGTWREILVAVNERRKLARAEQRRQVELRQMITAEEMANLVAMLVAILQAHLRDYPEVRRAITVDIQRVLEREAPRLPE